MNYLVEFQDANDKQVVEDCYWGGLHKARRRARYLSTKDHSLIVYVVAYDEEARHGAEAYAYGRRDYVDGRMA